MPLQVCMLLLEMMAGAPILVRFLGIKYAQSNLQFYFCKNFSFYSNIILFKLINFWCYKLKPLGGVYVGVMLIKHHVSHLMCSKF